MTIGDPVVLERHKGDHYQCLLESSVLELAGCDDADVDSKLNKYILCLASSR